MPMMKSTVFVMDTAIMLLMYLGSREKNGLTSSKCLLNQWTFLYFLLDPDYTVLERVVGYIKAASGCSPIIVVTSKQEIPQGQEIEMHSILTGFGASLALFVENYLIDVEGEGPTDDDLDLKKHLDLCKVIHKIQQEYDVHQKGVVESKISWHAFMQLRIVRFVLFILLFILLLRILIGYIGGLANQHESYRQYQHY